MIINTDLIYPIGSIYLTTSSVSPQTLFGGTWEQITNDAYLKIVTSNAGSLGGTSSNHKIPVSSMPSHTHSVATVYPFTTGGARTAVANSNSNNRTGTANDVVDATGGGQPYYPYYYGIYVWKRTA